MWRHWFVFFLLAVGTKHENFIVNVTTEATKKKKKLKKMKPSDLIADYRNVADAFFSSHMTPLHPSPPPNDKKNNNEKQETGDTVNGSLFQIT